MIKFRLKTTRDYNYKIVSYEQRRFFINNAQALRRKSIHDGMSFYDFEKRLSEIINEMATLSRL
jgi:hypothetical protein